MLDTSNRGLEWLLWSDACPVRPAQHTPSFIILWLYRAVGCHLLLSCICMAVCVAYTWLYAYTCALTSSCILYRLLWSGTCPVHTMIIQHAIIIYPYPAPSCTAGTLLLWTLLCMSCADSAAVVVSLCMLLHFNVGLAPCLVPCAVFNAPQSSHLLDHGLSSASGSLNLSDMSPLQFFMSQHRFRYSEIPYALQVGCCGA